MTTAVLGIMLLSALCHATWNAIAKHVVQRETMFTVAIGVSLVVYSPLAARLYSTRAFPIAALPWVLASATAEVLYFIALARTYRQAPLTTMYPVVRGFAPTATLLLSVLLMGAPVTAKGVAGVLAIVSGIFMMNESLATLPTFWRTLSSRLEAVKWAALTGLFSACANLADKAGAMLMSGVLFKYAVFIMMFLGKLAVDRRLTPGVSLGSVAKRYPLEALAAGFLVYGANSLSIYAMESTPVAYVAAAKELSIVFATIIGVLFLKERVTGWKVACILLIVSGVMLMRVA